MEFIRQLPNLEVVSGGFTIIVGFVLVSPVDLSRYSVLVIGFWVLGRFRYFQTGVVPDILKLIKPKTMSVIAS